MLNVMRKLWKNEGGFVISVELILIVTILVIGLVSGWTMLRDAVLAELADTAHAVGSIDQGFAVSGVTYSTGVGANSASFDFVDAQDGADVDVNGISGVGATGLVVTSTQSDGSGNANEGT